MITLGVDLAASDRKTAACTVEWRNGVGRAVESILGISDGKIIKRIDQADRVGIDVPFGWPDEFVDALAAYKDKPAWPSVTRDRLRLRETDRFVRDKAGKTPLSVSSNWIAVAAMRAAALFTELAAQGQRVDRGGLGKVVEVYPGAALKVWQFDAEGYKGAKGLRKRLSLVAAISERTRGWLDLTAVISELERNDNILDALLCALIARSAALGLCESIPRDSTAAARREGWIALPKPGSLEKLRGE